MVSTIQLAHRSFAQFHENQAVVAWWQRVFGRSLAWLSPKRRRVLLSIGSICAVIISPLFELTKSKVSLPANALGNAVVIVALFSFTWLCYRAAISFLSLPAPVRRRPQIALHSVFWLIVVAFWLTTSANPEWRTILGCLVALIPLVIWRCGYMLLSAQRGRVKGTRFRDHLIYLFPIWHASSTPYGKGLDFLSRHEAKTPEELAQSQLAGIKLFILAGLWMMMMTLMDGAIYGAPGFFRDRVLCGYSLSVPHLGKIIRNHAGVPQLMSWFSLYCELIWQVLKQATHGHLAIGLLRFFGFNVFRNTYKPLLSESLIVFWGRYFYYFKELLAELFFFPIFAKWFRLRPQLRLFSAVMASAFLGNLYFHVIKNERLMSLGDPLKVLDSFDSRAFYCLLLALGLFVSMVREQNRTRRSHEYGWLRRSLRIGGVWTFFALIFIWHDAGDIAQQTEFFLSLFALR